MIPINELRIGSWFYQLNFDDSIEYNQVSSINTKEQVLPIYANGNKKKFQITQCHPIPLTPQILKQSGFEQSELFENCFTLKPFAINIHEWDYTFVFNGGYSVKIKYVHQLQNLWYALTGEELEAKL